MRIDMLNKQKELEAFYNKKFLENAMLDEYSSPHLISLNNARVNTDIMIIGQETNSWYGSYLDFRNRGVENQMKIYDAFIDENYQKMNTLFWRYMKKIINNNNVVPVWTNIFKFDLGDARGGDKNISKASTEEYAEIIQFHQGILAREIEIIQPKIIIFFTGHTYDKLFFDPIVKRDGDYKELYRSIDELEGIDEWKCAFFDLKKFDGFSNFKGKAFRTYHPIYLNRNLDKFGNRIVAFLKDEIEAI